MLRCCLVHPRSESTTDYGKPAWSAVHLGLGYVAAAIMRAGHEVYTINAEAETLDVLAVSHIVNSGQYDFCGLSPTCLTIHSALKIAEAIRAASPRTHICFGGHHATHCASVILRNHESVDSVVRGYGEATVVELLNRLQAGLLPHGVAGVYFRDQAGRIVTNADRDLSASDFPPFYPAIPPGCQQAHSYVMYTSRGCNNHCSFCSTPEFCGTNNLTGWQSRTPEAVVDEMAHICNLDGTHNPVEISLIDDNFFTPDIPSKTRAGEIARLILRRGLNVRLWAMVGARAISESDEALLALLWEAGLRRVLIGVEAGENETLRVYSKPSSREQNLNAIRLLSRHPFALHITMILFHPYASLAEVRRNAAYINEIQQMKNVCIYTSYCSRVLVFPGTGLYRRLLDDGMIDGKTAYLEPHAYKFVNKSVERLAAHMKDLEPFFAPVHWLMTDIRNRIAHGVGAENQSVGVEGIETLVSSVGSMFYRYFMESATATASFDDELHGIKTQTFLSNIAEATAKLADIEAQVRRADAEFDGKDSHSSGIFRSEACCNG